MSQVKTGLEEPKHFPRRDVDDMFNHGPGNSTRSRGRGGGYGGKRRLDLLYSEGSWREGCSLWGGGRSAPGALWGGSGKKVVVNNSAQYWGVLARPSSPLRGGTGVERVPKPHLASFQMLSGVADSQILV